MKTCFYYYYFRVDISIYEIIQKPMHEWGTNVGRLTRTIVILLVITNYMIRKTTINVCILLYNYVGVKI